MKCQHTNLREDRHSGCNTNTGTDAFGAIFSLVYRVPVIVESQLTVFGLIQSLCIRRRLHPFARRCFHYYKVKKESMELRTDIYQKVNCLVFEDYGYF